MTKKPTLKTITSGYTSTTTLNDNFEALVNAFDNTVSRDGSTPNSMTSDLDLNSNDLLNVNVIGASSLTLNGTLVVPSGVDPVFSGTVSAFGAGFISEPNAAGGRAALGLGALATQDITYVNTNVEINNDNWSGSDLEIVNGGTGASSAGAARNNLGLGSAATTDILDEDDMVSDSDTDVPSQQSVKSYVDGKVGNLLILRNEQTSGTSGAALTASSWTTHNINTVQYNNISGASLSTKQITLPAGTYRLSGWGGASTTFNTTGKSDRFKPRLRNITDGTTTLVGGNGLSSGYSGTLADGHQVPLNGVFTIATTKVFELQMYASAGGNATEGFAFGSGEVEVYAELVFEKLG